MAKKLKFGSPAWRKKYMKPKKKNAAKKKQRAGRKTKPAASRKTKPTASRKTKPARKNPSLRKLGPKGTGWIRTRRVKIIRNRGEVQILVERPRRK